MKPREGLAFFDLFELVKSGLQLAWNDNAKKSMNKWCDADLKNIFAKK
jgi:hypothetical protein